MYQIGNIRKKMQSTSAEGQLSKKLKNLAIDVIANGAESTNLTAVTTVEYIKTFILILLYAFNSTFFVKNRYVGRVCCGWITIAPGLRTALVFTTTSISLVLLT